ncbi:MAG: HAD family hydrolase [Spirochaetota bacterium]
MRLTPGHSHGYRIAVKINAVLFDLDGTLLHTLPDIRDAMNGVLADWSLPRYEIDDYRRMVGWGIEYLAELVVPEDRREMVDIGALAAELKQAYRSYPVKGTVPFDGVRELIDELHGAGMPMAILSNKAQEITDNIVRTVFGEGLFSVVYGARDDLPRKPDPAAARRIASELGVEPHRMVFVGDSAIDMETAQVAGMLPIGVAWGYREVEELWMHGAAAVVSSPREIAELIRSEIETVNE